MRSLLLAALVVVSSSGCEFGKSCNLMYAPDFLDISFATPLSDPGEWTVTVTGSDGYAATCVATLPLAEDDSASCDNGTAGLVISATDGSIVGVLLYGAAPPELTVSAALDGVEVGHGDATPAYDVDEPNGEGCGERLSGGVTVTLETTS